MPGAVEIKKKNKVGFKKISQIKELLSLNRQGKAEPLSVGAVICPRLGPQSMPVRDFEQSPLNLLGEMCYISLSYYPKTEQTATKNN